MLPVKPANRPRLAAFVVLAASLAASAASAGCLRTQVRPAPFRERADSVAPGDLRGPFDGRVLDAGNDRPIGGAQVYAVWQFGSASAPAGVHEWLGTTDLDGRYRVPRLADADAAGKRLIGFRLVVIKRGYVAYRSDRRFEDFGPRLDFAQRKNDVRLGRFGSDISHVRHLRYVGGGATIAELTRWELPEAAAELGGGAVAVAVAPPAAAGGPPLPAARLLAGSDVQQITGYAGTFDVGDLGDEPPSPSYNSLHLRARGASQDHDIAIRVWKVDPADAEKLFDRLVGELPSVKESTELGDRSLRAIEPDGSILGFAYLVRPLGMVVLLQCGSAQCKTGDILFELARRSKEHLDGLVTEGVIK